MPSPCPGMDPYLEDPAHWPNVHARLIATIQTALNRVVRPKYLAVIEERVYVSDEPEDLPRRRAVRVPDVTVRTDAATLRPTDPVAVIDRPVVMRTILRISRRERRVVILDPGPRSVVAVVEVLSPANKRTGSRGRAHYQRKRREVIASPASLVEIDLLRDGATLFPRPAGSPTGYAVHVSPPALRPTGNVWSIPLPARLPVVSVPLLAPDPDAPLDLQMAFTTAYEDGSFDGLVDYGHPPVPLLPPELDVWADELLKQKGLR